MNKAHLVPFVGALSVLALSGCSWMTSFVVRNNSDSPIQIEYSLDKRWHGSRRYVSPRIVESVQLDERAHHQYQLDWSEASHSCDETNGVSTVTLSVPPAHSALVTEVMNYTGRDKRLTTIPGLLGLSIISAEEEVSYNENQLSKGFERRSLTCYVLDYD